MSETEALLRQVTDLVGHLRWRVGPARDGELRSADLAGDPDCLVAAVAETSDGRGSHDSQVLGSLWWQAYAYRVAGTTAACWVLGGAAPDPSIEAGTAVGIARSRPSSVIYGADRQPLADRKELAARLFAGHLDRIANRLRERHALGEQLLWGNAAAGIASALSALGSAPGGPPVRDKADELIDALPHGIKELGHWEATGWSFRRRTCCLWWKTSLADGELCEDCSRR
jgi:ferric iron reductase protein FhuF